MLRRSGLLCCSLRGTDTHLIQPDQATCSAVRLDIPTFVTAPNLPQPFDNEDFQQELQGHLLPKFAQAPTTDHAHVQLVQIATTPEAVSDYITMVVCGMITPDPVGTTQVDSNHNNWPSAAAALLQLWVNRTPAQSLPLLAADGPRLPVPHVPCTSALLQQDACRTALDFGRFASAVDSSGPPAFPYSFASLPTLVGLSAQQMQSVHQHEAPQQVCTAQCGLQRHVVPMLHQLAGCTLADAARCNAAPVAAMLPLPVPSVADACDLLDSNPCWPPTHCLLGSCTPLPAMSSRCKLLDMGRERIDDLPTMPPLQLHTARAVHLLLRVDEESHTVCAQLTTSGALLGMCLRGTVAVQ